MNEKEHLTSEGLLKIVNIKAALNLGLSEALSKAFPNISPVSRPLVDLTEILDPNWLAGFTSGEGCFFVNIQKSEAYKTGFAVSLYFFISRHIRDFKLIESFVKYLVVISKKIHRLRRRRCI